MIYHCFIRLIHEAHKHIPIYAHVYALYGESNDYLDSPRPGEA